MNNPFSLNGKTILITGASSGIGKQISLTVSAMGAKVLITGRNEERLKDTLSLLSGSGHSLISCDLNNPNEVDKLLNQLQPLDGIVLASGIMKTTPFKFLNEEILAEIMNTNFNSPALLLNKIIRKKLLNKSSSVVFISSISGNLIGLKGNSAYSSSKGAINALVKVLALELASQNIRVNSISPGMILTGLWENGSFSKIELAEDEKKYPLGYGTAKDVGNTTVFLLSEAGKWITGSSLVLDGGFSIQ